MKKIALLFALLCCSAAGAATLADDDRPITVSELPQAAQQFLKSHFAGTNVAWVTVDGNFFDKDYEVGFPDGSKIEFSRNGEWKEVEMRGASAVPASVVPEAIRNYVARNYPQTVVRAIARDRRGYEVELSNGLELEFDNAFRLLKIDD